jgi:hypothetical protein
VNAVPVAARAQAPRCCVSIALCEIETQQSGADRIHDVPRALCDVLVRETQHAIAGKRQLDVALAVVVQRRRRAVSAE